MWLLCGQHCSCPCRGAWGGSCACQSLRVQEGACGTHGHRGKAIWLTVTFALGQTLLGPPATYLNALPAWPMGSQLPLTLPGTWPCFPLGRGASASGPLHWLCGHNSQWPCTLAVCLQAPPISHDLLTPPPATFLE